MAKGSAVSPARLAAFDILLNVEAGAFSTVLLAAKEPELRQNDRALCHELVLGVLRWQLQLDKIIEHFAGREVAGLDLPVLVALRLGVYQLRFLSRVPASAAVNESVNMVGLARLSSARSFVNAVLRRATREPDYDPTADVESEVERLAIQTSHPAWLIARWIESFGIKEAKAFSRANNEMPPTSMRVVKLRAAEDVLQRLKDAGATVEPSQLTAGAWRVAGAVSLMRELASGGEIYIQDEASQLVAQAVDAQPGYRVIDLCAAPGGKATQIADLAGDQALVVAADLSFTRLVSTRAIVSTQGLRSLQLVQLNAEESLPFRAETFDRVLVDAPCSGTGTLRRNPEIRWRISAADIHDLAGRQRRILLEAARVVRPGGRLVYSTCSVEVEENESVVDHFLSATDEFRQVGIDLVPRSWASSARTWPQHDASDGFFIAAFERNQRELS